VPFFIETTGSKNGVQALPANGVKSLPEVQFQDYGGNFSLVTAAKQIRSIDEIFSYATPMNKTSLVWVNDRKNSRFESIDQHLGKEFHGAVLERNWPEGIRRASPLFLWEEDKVSSVEPVQKQRARVKIREKFQDVLLNGRPKVSVKGRTKTVRPRTRVHVHTEQRVSDFISGERRGEVKTSHIKLWIESREGEAPSGCTRSAQQGDIKIPEDVTLCLMGKKQGAAMLKTGNGICTAPARRSSMKKT